MKKSSVQLLMKCRHPCEHEHTAVEVFCTAHLAENVHLLRWWCIILGGRLPYRSYCRECATVKMMVHYTGRTSSVPLILQRMCPCVEGGVLYCEGICCNAPIAENVPLWRRWCIILRGRLLYRSYCIECPLRRQWRIILPRTSSVPLIL
jgi:hypothetical protein